MDEEDQKDIIRKVKTSGADDSSDGEDDDFEDEEDEGFGEEGKENKEEKDLDEGFDNENSYVVKYKYDENSYT